MTNCVFSFYMMSISYEITKTPRLSNELFSQYEGTSHFSANMHHSFIQACADQKHQWFKLPYVVTKDDILAVVQQWPAEWLKDVGTKHTIPVPQLPMWAQALVIHSSKNPRKTVKNKLSRSRVKVTRVDMMAMQKKKKTRFKLLHTLISRISTRRQNQRK